MPAYTLNPLGAPQSASPLADMAKAFMQSPSYADQFLQDANLVLAPPSDPNVPAVSGAWNGPRPRPATNMGGDLSQWSDRDLLAAAITAEASNEPDIGKYGVGNVIMNRVNSPSYPGSIRDVVLQPGQISAFNGVTGYAGGEGANDLWRAPGPEEYSVADAIIAGMAPDYTNGALNYYNPAHASPAWGGPGFHRLHPGSGHVFGTAR